MEKFNEPYYSYSWHQSHDQATVLLMVPYDTQEEDVTVVIERNYLIAGVRGQPPTVKGRLYANVNKVTSAWKLEPRISRLSARDRTTSTTSTASSYAFVSDPEISSSFAASLESGQVSDAEDLYGTTSPTLSSPSLSSAGEQTLPRHRRKINSVAVSRSVSPGHALHSMTSSYSSSLDSLHSPHSSRLLTLYLEKDQSIIWPSLIVGPVLEALSPYMANSVVFSSSHELEHQYNMDPTSLTLIALELSDIRDDREEAFECFLRAWHQAHVPSATMRLASHYLPLQATSEVEVPANPAPRGTTAYYFQCIGGQKGLAQLYLEAGMLHLEGGASTLLSSSYSSLSSIRMPLGSQAENGEEAWKRDREAAQRYFERARILQPNLDIPSLERHARDSDELEMPSIEVGESAPESIQSGPSHYADSEPPLTQRRRKKEEMLIGNQHDELDNTWYLYIPGLVGAGTALLVVGIVGALSFSTWSRRNQGS